jgi:hypothetical protein
MDNRCVTPVKQISVGVMECPGAPTRVKKTISKTSGLTIEIPPFDGEFTDPRDPVNITDLGGAVKKSRKE